MSDKIEKIVDQAEKITEEVVNFVLTEAPVVGRAVEEVVEVVDEISRAIEESGDGKKH